MNIYAVISEQLAARVPILDFGEGPMEPYAIAELVAADTRAQAKWDAWKTDRDSFDGDPREMPKFSVRLVKRSVSEERGIVTDKYPELWGNVAWTVR
jgi:hypothetical protein